MSEKNLVISVRMSENIG